MSLSSDQLRTAWKAFRAAGAKMVKVPMGGDTIRVAPGTEAAWGALDTVLQAHNYKIRNADTASYADRNISGTNKKSLHAYGIALDINWKTNPVKYNPQVPVRYSNGAAQVDRAADVEAGLADTDMTRQMIDDILAIRTNNGQVVFAWGGRWTSLIDTMHFQLDAKPNDLAGGINPATVRSDGQETGGQSEPDEGIVWTDKFERAHRLIEKWEGGFVHHPADPGGATNFGITKTVLEAWRGRPVSVAEVRDLTIEEARRIFFVRYWTLLNVEQLDYSIALMTYNCGVNSGVTRGAKFLQRTLNMQGNNLAVDGKIGPLTLAAAAAVDQERAVRDFANLYEQFYRSLSHWPVFGNGWMNRLNDVSSAALTALGVSGETVPSQPIKPPVSPDIAHNTASASNIMNNSTPQKTLTTIDKALGGQTLAGKKTLLASGIYVLLLLLEEGGLMKNEGKVIEVVLPFLATFGGLGALSKVERSLEAISNKKQ